ncbi:hypothetical protein [Actinomadura verrucosospora]|uniref:Uncharacterized protein n=1 Tax=Actinomadura verrucosospora TaxID=46165 RepID=A0A7D3VPD4_ACTVE|nr:hypothetical protein [Actinomadura verrucosospora]QKG19170.1 hypothetical protein ACTIVE_0806 [Actinomadura verrucosospora]
MGHKFSLVLSREITDEESAILREAGCACATFGPDSLPTDASVPVTKMDFDDTESPSLAEAIESALEAVKKVPDLSVPGLTVPAVPAADSAEAPDGGSAAQEHGEPGVLVGEVVEEEQAPGKGAAKATAAKAGAAAESD